MTNTIEILGKSHGCTPCSELKMLLDMESKPYMFYDITERGNLRIATIKKEMMARGLRSVPCVFLNGEFFAVGEEAVLKAGEM